ncbi:hypothetical protein EDD17DRAFT_1604367 [Pisolithus thermaeus]|nr:hypothetical protein EV401DRAFT_1899044 [Pisolithus croceorrhizus]KAI6160291.1 hypothetical protein EDD17DRAFT_1604367 [Pisolithus thermaeus]
MSAAQPLRISYIELQSARDVEYVEVLFLGCRRGIRQQDENHFREEFPEPITVQGEAFSFSVHRKRWYSFCIPAVNSIQINVRDILSGSRSHKFQTERSKLDITIGLSPNCTSVDVVPAQDNSTPPNTDSVRSKPDITIGVLPDCASVRLQGVVPAQDNSTPVNTDSVRSKPDTTIGESPDCTSVVRI